MSILILDTETTGKEEGKQVIEFAYSKLEFPSLEEKENFHQYYKPSIPIELGAIATHHILMEDLEDAEEVQPTLPEDIKYIIGHNIDFDWEALGKPDVKRICTLAMARKLIPEIKTHT